MSDEGVDEKTQDIGGNYSGEGKEVREENEENFQVENDKDTVYFGEGEELREKDVELGTENQNRETMQSNKRIKQMSIDRLGELPDSLITHILSFLGVKGAAITSVLSKRWQLLWSDLPRLEFWESNGEYWDSSRDGDKISRFVSWVNRALAIRTANYLENFEVSLQYSSCYASDVDVWVEFAVKNKVKKLILMLNSYKDYYLLPDMIYSNSPLRCLWVRGSIMAPQRTIQWKSLTELFLKEVELNQNVIDDILSGCPVLYSLELIGCWGFNRLEVNSRSVHTLKVEDCEDDEDEPLLEISAPYVHSLDISLFPEGRKLQVKNIPSLVKAYIDFNGYGWESTSVEAMSIAKDLLESSQHVKELDLGRKCFEVVSTMAVNDWQLPQSTRRCLEVSTQSDYEHSISGIIGLLESSPNLETLVIMGFDTDEDYAFLDPAAKDDLNRDLSNLKTVNIKNFTDPTGEPMLTLARILLKRATGLEKMVIVTDVENINDFIKIGQALLTYPRSSQKAVVVFP